MTVKSGTHSIGPENGRLTISTFKAGMGAKVGHDLVLEARRWNGTVEVNADNPTASSVEVTIDARSFEIVSATGGVKALSDKDSADIAKNMNDKVLQTGKFPDITFRSTQVSPTAIQGDLTIVGNTQPVSLQLSTQDGAGDTTMTGRATVTQTKFGIKPFSAMMGALKVKDDVDMQVELTLPSA